MSPSKKQETWIEKYRPQKFSDIKGQDQALEKLKAFLKYFGGKGKKSILLHGPPGTGKTTIAMVAAKESNSEIFELNASDLRNKDKLKEILRPAIEQKSLGKEKKIILVDEVDGISEVDRGGLSELISLLEITTHPVIITANDVWSRKLSDLRKKCEIIQLKDVDSKIISDVLKDILGKECLVLNENIIESIAARARGDVRAAVNDLQSVSRMRDPSKIILDERNKEIDIFTVMKKILREKPTNDTLKLFDSLNMNIDEILLWFDENIPEEYQGEELVRAYELMSKIDVFRGRVHKQQYWRFLVYQNLLLSYGIASAKKRVKTRYTTYKKPERILKIWLHNQKTLKKKSIAIKYSQYVHVGEKRALNEFRIIGPILANNSKIQKELKLSEEEIQYLDYYKNKD
ncbi:Replication factor C large subunit [uncultured archaeon]|nr:Replication factor C large subunit [uncultured archaeon]